MVEISSRNAAKRRSTSSLRVLLAFSFLGVGCSEQGPSEPKELAGHRPMLREALTFDGTAGSLMVASCERVWAVDGGGHVLRCTTVYGDDGSGGTTYLSGLLMHLDWSRRRYGAVNSREWLNTGNPPPDLSGGQPGTGGNGQGSGTYCAEDNPDVCFGSPNPMEIFRSLWGACDTRFPDCLMPIDTRYLHNARNALNKLQIGSADPMCAEAAATLDSLWRGGLLFQRGEPACQTLCRPLPGNQEAEDTKRRRTVYG